MLELLLALGSMADVLLRPRFIVGVVLTVLACGALHWLIPASNVRDLLTCLLGMAGIVGSIIWDFDNEKPPTQPPH